MLCSYVWLPEKQIQTKLPSLDTGRIITLVMFKNPFVVFLSFIHGGAQFTTSMCIKVELSKIDNSGARSGARSARMKMVKGESIFSTISQVR